MELTIKYPAAGNITASNNISFDQFAVLPPSVTITITEIPSQYQGGFGWMDLVCTETGDWPFLNWSGTAITGSSSAFRFWLTNPGTYDVLLDIEGQTGWISVIAPARTITANTSIPFGEFALSPLAFSEPIERSGRVLPSRSNARPLRAHR